MLCRCIVIGTLLSCSYGGVAGQALAQWPLAHPQGGRWPTSDARADWPGFKQAVARASSPYYALGRWEPVRQQAFAWQLNLENLLAWRIGAPVNPAGGYAVGTATAGATDIYSNYFDPFEPTPFWFGSWLGYPPGARAAQPLGHYVTPSDGDLTRGYVYEPVYADQLPQPDQVAR